MGPKRNRDLSVTVTAFYMKLTGVWLADNYIEKRQRKLGTIYTLCMLSYGIWLETRDVYYTFGDFSTAGFICISIGIFGVPYCLCCPAVNVLSTTVPETCNLASVAIAVLKMLMSLVHKTDLLNLMTYAKQNFWHSDYDPHEQVILDTCKRTCTLLICTFSFFAQTTVVFYVIKPVVANIGKNESDRILPFDLWLDLPWSMTPYFEILFFIQVLTVFHVGVCYLCFDNFLCLLNLHTATQFRILQYRLTKLYSLKECHKNLEITTEVDCGTSKCYREFKNSIQQHQALLEYCKELEKVFTIIVLGQVILFSLMICLDGYLILLADAPTTLRLTFLFHITGCMVQLLMFTYSCDTLTRESSNVAGAAYEGMWAPLPMDKDGKKVREALPFVIMRSQSSCCLTAGGFFAVSLETYTTVLSTAVSYFTLLTQY